MLPVNDLGSDSPLYFSLLEHPCDNALKRLNGTVVTSSLWFDAQSRCLQKIDRPCVSVETRTCTHPSTRCGSAKCSPLANESPRERIRVRHSVRRLQLHLDRQLANRTAYRRATLRGNNEHDSRALAASLLSACVVVENLHTVHIAPHSTITTVLCPAFKCRTRRKECRSGLSLSGMLFVGSRASWIK